MSPSSNEPERKQTAEVGEEAMPLPVDAKVIFLGGIFFLLFLAACLTFSSASNSSKRRSPRCSTFGNRLRISRDGGKMQVHRREAPF